MSPQPQQVVLGLLWLSPIIHTVATIGFVMFMYNFRKNLGARNMKVGALATFAGVVLVLHAGYFFAPMWWQSGRHLLAAATMLPVALAVLGAGTVALSQTQLLRDWTRTRVGLRLAAFGVCGLLMLAYLGPLVLMLAASA